MLKIIIEGCKDGPITLECEEFITMTMDKQGQNTVISTPRYVDVNPDLILVNELTKE